MLYTFAVTDPARVADLADRCAWHGLVEATPAQVLADPAVAELLADLREVLAWLETQLEPQEPGPRDALRRLRARCLP